MKLTVDTSIHDGLVTINMTFDSAMRKKWIFVWEAINKNVQMVNDGQYHIHSVLQEVYFTRVPFIRFNIFLRNNPRNSLCIRNWFDT